MPRQPQTKTQGYANAFYARCVEEADDTVIDGKKVKVWKGFIGKTCRSIGVPRGMENKIVKPLTEMGCIQVTQRGVGSYPTVMILFYPPTEDLWVGLESPVPLTRTPSYDILISRLENVEKSLGGVNLAAALKNIETRLQALERQHKKGS